MKARVLILSADKKKCFSSSSSLGKTLKQFGYAPLWAANPGEALRHMRFEPIDLFVCDLGRPLHIDRGLIEIFHEANPRIPIILFSPVQSVEEALIASRYGTLLYKPISHLALIETMGMLLAAQAKGSPTRVKDSQPLVSSH